jgi:hypothetical protein
MNAYQCDTCAAWHLGSSNTSFRIQDRFDRLLANPPKLKRPKIQPVSPPQQMSTKGRE